MRWDIDELENTCDQLHIFAQAISLSPKFALYFKRHQMIHELVNIYAKLHIFTCLLEMMTNLAELQYNCAWEGVKLCVRTCSWIVFKQVCH